MPPSRARSFGTAAAAYARHRPGYPPDAVDWALRPVADRPDLRLLDLAAGTGKLTASLLPRGQVTAVDPDPAMLTELRARHPEVDAREGSAEEIPIPDDAMDAILVGQAFHWFDPDRALPEIARVLKPGGVLAVLWNGDNAHVDWVRGFHEAGGWESRVVRERDETPRLPDHPAFAPTEYARFDNPFPTSVDGLIAMLATHSWALIAEPAEREATLARVRAYLTEHPETAAGAFDLPQITDVLRAESTLEP
jgi:SAM-dependent methyltransferase